MEGESYLMKKLGFHVRPTNQILVECLKRKVGIMGFSTAADFPIVDRDLYSEDPWNLLKDDDPWEIEETSDGSSFVQRSIFVFTKLKLSGKRCVRTTSSGTWDGRSRDEPITADGRRKPADGGNSNNIIIGSKRYFEFKVKKDGDREGTRHRHGHWMMHQIKLEGESLKGLEGAALQAANANVEVVCIITQKLEKDSPAYCSWPKGILDVYMEEYLRLGFFTPALTTTTTPPPQEEEDHKSTTIGNSNKRKYSAAISHDHDHDDHRCWKKESMYEDNQKPASDHDQVVVVQETISFSKEAEKEKEDDDEFGDFVDELNQTIPEDGSDGSTDHEIASSISSDQYFMSKRMEELGDDDVLANCGGLEAALSYQLPKTVSFSKEEDDGGQDSCDLDKFVDELNETIPEDDGSDSPEADDHQMHIAAAGLEEDDNDQYLTISYFSRMTEELIMNGDDTTNLPALRHIHIPDDVLADFTFSEMPFHQIVN